LITQIITAGIEHYLLYLGLVAAIVGGFLSYIYIPVVGKPLAVCCFSLAAGIGAYQLGYNARANLDISIQLQKELAATQAQLAQATADLKTNQDIAAASAAREQVATKTAFELQSKVTDYEKQLADDAEAAGQPPRAAVVTVIHDGKSVTCPVVHQVNHCLLTDRDVTSLRGIDAGPHPRH
jgi:hypothetical protein